METAATSFVWTRKRVLALAALCLAQALDGIDATVVNVALPVIRGDLGFAIVDLSWVVNAYMMVFGGFLLLGGRLGDLLGHRNVLLGGIGLFTAASLVAGLAQNAGTLVGARAVQGLGAAFIAPMTLALIALLFPEGRPRSRAFAVWGAVTGVSTALGLLAGGLLADGPGWRWIFFVNLPVGALLLVAMGRLLPGAAPVRVSSPRGRFDVVGAVTSTAGVALLAYAVLQTATHSWGSARTIGLLAGAVVLLGYFAFHEVHVAKDPLVAFTLFRNRSVTGANVIQVLRGGAMFGVFYFVTLYLQEVLGYSALETGFAYVPLTVILIASAGLGPVMIRRVGAPLVIAAGSLITAGGLLLFAGASPQGEFTRDVLLPLVVTGLGFGVAVVPLTNAALAGVPSHHSGVASALLNVSAQLGGALGLAVLSSVAVSRTTAQLRAGATAEVALTEGFRFGYSISAALMAITVVVALVVLRRER